MEEIGTDQSVARSNVSKHLIALDSSQVSFFKELVVVSKISSNEILLNKVKEATWIKCDYQNILKKLKNGRMLKHFHDIHSILGLMYSDSINQNMKMGYLKTENYCMNKLCPLYVDAKVGINFNL